MRVACSQNPAPQALQGGMLHNAFHQPLAQPAAAMHIEHEYVPDIGDRREVADHPGKADLRAGIIINAKTQRVLDGSRHNVSWNAFRPITIRQEIVDRIQIKARWVSTYGEFAAPVLGDHSGIGSLSRPHGSILNPQIINHEGYEVTRRKPLEGFPS
jgi:hypothetical protein